MSQMVLQGPVGSELQHRCKLGQYQTKEDETRELHTLLEQDYAREPTVVQIPQEDGRHAAFVVPILWWSELGRAVHSDHFRRPEARLTSRDTCQRPRSPRSRACAAWPSALSRPRAADRTRCSTATCAHAPRHLNAAALIERQTCKTRRRGCSRTAGSRGPSACSGARRGAGPPTRAGPRLGRGRG